MGGPGLQPSGWPLKQHVSSGGGGLAWTPTRAARRHDLSMDMRNAQGFASPLPPPQLVRILLPAPEGEHQSRAPIPRTNPSHLERLGVHQRRNLGHQVGLQPAGPSRADRTGVAKAACSRTLVRPNKAPHITGKASLHTPARDVGHGLTHCSQMHSAAQASPGAGPVNKLLAPTVLQAAERCRQ
jgi:hypothetical protein